MCILIMQGSANRAAAWKRLTSPAVALDAGSRMASLALPKEVTRSEANLGMADFVYSTSKQIGT